MDHDLDICILDGIDEKRRPIRETKALENRGIKRVVLVSNWRVVESNHSLFATVRGQVDQSL